MTTDTSEKGLERLICTALTGHPCDPASVSSGPPPSSGAPGDARGGCGWIGGSPSDYEREYCVDLAQLAAFLQTTQPKVAEALDLGVDGPTQRKFLARLQGEISKRGTIDVLRRGIKDGPHHIDLFYGTPSPGNDRARTLYDANRFSVTRQLRYSRDETQRALDLGLFINGLPVATFELKNSLTKQTVEDAVEQYKRDRDPRERLFEFGRCVVHFAVDDHEVRFCTQLKGKASWFLPFNLGWNDGAGNPPNPDGIKTDYLWKRLLNREGLITQGLRLLGYQGEAPSLLYTEGAVITGGRLRLFQRGNGAPRDHLLPVNATCELDLPALLHFLDHGGEPPTVQEVGQYDLGSLSGVRLTFTDAAAEGADILFLAAAEDSPDAVRDGPVVGVALGVIRAGSGQARLAKLLDEDGRPFTGKAEGLLPDHRNPRVLYLVLDRDDPALPAELCVVQTEGY